MGIHWVRALAVCAGCANLLQNRSVCEILRVVFRREQGRCVLSQIVLITIPNRWDEDVNVLQVVMVSL
jgi:hypothetical protein